MGRRRKGVRRSKGDPEGLASILEALKRQPEMGKHFEVAKVWRHWPELVGPELAPYGQPLGLRDTTLIVEVAASVWMHRYAATKWSILSNINDLIGGEILRDLFLVLSEDLPASGKIVVPQDDVD